MSLRTRLLIAFSTLIVLPLLIYAFGIRSEVTRRVSSQYEERVASLVRGANVEMEAAGVDLGRRLDAVRARLAEDNRFRRAAVDGDPSQRAYLLDVAGETMRLTGLTFFQIQDESGRILSSGHFRNEFDRRETGLPHLVTLARPRAVLVIGRSPERPFPALVRVDSLTMGGRRFHLVGGSEVGADFLGRLAEGGEALGVALVYPGGELATYPDQLARWQAARGSEKATPYTSIEPATMPLQNIDGLLTGELPLAFARVGSEASPVLLTARLVITHPTEPLAALLRALDRWVQVALVATIFLALGAATGLSQQMSRPLRELAARADRIDLERPELDFPADRADEVGTLSRVLAAMTARLRAGAQSLREAERRATVGEMARQVNHDIKNGLAPIRNVLRHLVQVGREDPGQLPQVLSERQRTLDASVEYLETLAANYARLSPARSLHDCDVNAIVRASQQALQAGRGRDSRLHLELAAGLPPVAGDPVALRRILDNLIGNAIDSLQGEAGRVTVETVRDEEQRICVRVTDTGRGMTAQELERVFDDFYTTKEKGTGLGLSIVRRLVADLGGSLETLSEPGQGTVVTVALPPAPGSDPAAGLPGSPRRGSVP